MRVTQNSLYASIRFYLERNSSRLLDAQETLITQKRINRVSDDPVAAPRLLSIKSNQARIEQFLRNIDQAESLAGIHDTVLGEAANLLVRAKELLLVEANGATSTPEGREARRLEIASLTSQLAGLANTQYAGRYLFSGYRTTTAAFADVTAAATPDGSNTGGAVVTLAQVTDTNQVDLDNTYQISFTGPGTYDVIDTTTATTIVTGAVYVSGEPIRFASLEVRISDDTGTPATGDVFDVAITAAGVYQGDSGRQRVEIQNGTFVQQNMTGDEVFQGAGLAGGVDIFSVLNQINLAMRSNDRAAIDPLLDDLDKARSQLVSERLKAGTRSNLLADTRNRHVDIQFGLDVLRSNLEDIDLSEAITQLTQQQVAYEATLAVAGRIAGISLLDFLK